MNWLTQRFNFLFRSTKGLILAAIAMIALTAAFFGMLSGPMMEFGVRDFVVKAFRMSLWPENARHTLPLLARW